MGARPCDGCSPRDARKRLALQNLARAHVSGALAGLGDLEAGTLGLTLDRSSIDAETAAFDSRLNAWMSDYQAATPKIPANVIVQIDDFITRWRTLKDSWYFFGKVRADAVIAMEAEFNRFRDQVAGYAGKESAITAATVIVDGVPVRADQIPPGTDTLSRVESIAKWAALLVGAVAAWKIASDLGLVAKVGKLISGGGGAAGGEVRRFGSAKRNPKKKKRHGDFRDALDDLRSATRPTTAADRLRRAKSRPAKPTWATYGEWNSLTGSQQRQIALSTSKGGGGLKNPRARDDLARPTGLLPFGDAAYNVIVAYLRAHRLTETGGCKAFYKPKPNARGKRGYMPVLRVVYEGSDVRAAMDADSSLYPALAKKLDTLGMYIDYVNDYTAVVIFDWDNPRVVATLR